MKTKKIIFTAVLMAVVLFAQAALAQQVTIMVMTSPETEGLKAMAQEFTAQTGITIKFNEQGRMNYFTNVITQLVAGTTAFDLAQINSTYVTELAAAGVISNWDQYLNDPALTDLAAYDLDDVPIVYSYKDNIVMIPTDAMSELFYYRSDLIQTAPETWIDVLEVAKEYTKAFNPNSPTDYGLLIATLPGSEPPKLFYPILWSFGGDVFDAAGNVVLDSAETVAALEYYRSLRDVMPKDVASYDYPKIVESLKNGTVAMAPSFWNAGYNDIQAGSSPHKDDISVALVPGMKSATGEIERYPQTHSWGLVINGRSKNTEALWEFLKFATSTAGGKIHGINGGSPYRASILGDPSWASGEYYDLMSITYKIARSEPLVPFYSKMHEVMNQMLTNALTTDTPIEEIVRKTAQELEKL